MRDRTSRRIYLAARHAPSVSTVLFGLGGLVYWLLSVPV